MTITARKFTGRHFLIIIITAFATIISANLTLAFFAVKSFPGLDVANTYVASQQFDKRRRAQEALGWQSHLVYDQGVLKLHFEQADGSFARPKNLAIRIGSAASGQDDRLLAFTESHGVYRAPVTLESQNWMIFIDAMADDCTIFSERHPVITQ